MVGREFGDEAELQAYLMERMDVAGWLAYHTHDSRRSGAGFPDVVAVRGRDLIAVELKMSGKTLRPAQDVWLTALARAGVEVWVVRPESLAAFVARLDKGEIGHPGR